MRNGDHGFDHLLATGTIHVGDVAFGNFRDGFSIEGTASRCASPSTPTSSPSVMRTGYGVSREADMRRLVELRQMTPYTRRMLEAALLLAAIKAAKAAHKKANPLPPVVIKAA